MKNFKILLLLILAFSAISCSSILNAITPNNHNTNLYGTYDIQMSHTEWDSEHIAYAVEALRELNKLGPTFILSETPGDISVYNVDLAYNPPLECREIQCAARFVESTNRIEIDPVFTPGKYAFEIALMHEIGHFMGIQHICRYKNEIPQCSSVGYGEAIMNPSLTTAWQVQELDIRISSN